MRAFSNMTTRRLEREAEQLGVECEIRIIEAQEDGRYFVMCMDGEPLKQPLALGFTDEQARYTLKQGRWQRYVLRGAPTRLGVYADRRSKGSGASSKSGSSRRSHGRARSPWRYVNT